MKPRVLDLIRRHAKTDGLKTIGEWKAAMIATQKEIFGTTSTVDGIPLKVGTHEEVNRAANHMAAFGNYPAGMSGCFVVGINGGCGLECPVFRDGDCKSHEGFPVDALIEFGYIEEGA